MIDWLAAALNPQGLMLIALVFLPLERLWPMHREQGVLRRHWANDAIYFIVNRIPILLGLTMVIALIATASAALIPAAFREAVAAQPLWLQLIEIILFADLGFYLVHRLFHSVPWLWRFHAIHHSIEELDWLAAHRVHPVDQILTKGASLIPCFALGFSEWAIGAFFVIYQWHSLLLHANTAIGFGPLRWLIASPAFHHWHHANQPEAWNRNFAGQLALWDVLFGTAHMPRDSLPVRYGTDDAVPDDYARQLAYPFLPMIYDRTDAEVQIPGAPAPSGRNP